MFKAQSLFNAILCGALLRLTVAEKLPHSQHPLQFTESTIEASPLFSLHREVVEIPSISGDEHDTAEFLSSYLAAHNFTVQKQYVSPLTHHSTAASNQRFNVLAYPSASSLNSSRVLLTSHIDTVPPYIPYTIRSDSEIWGRGVVDAKACVAAQVRAAIDLYTSNTLDPSDGEVSLLFVVGEETGGDGMRAASSLGLTWEAAIFGEPTELKLASGHKGGMAITVTAHGKGGHSGYPWLGENANGMLIPALLALEKLELPWSEKYGNTTLNIGRMSGGYVFLEA